MARRRVIRWGLVGFALTTMVPAPLLALDESMALVRQAGSDASEVDVVLPVPSSILGVTAGTVLGAWKGEAGHPAALDPGMPGGAPPGRPGGRIRLLPAGSCRQSGGTGEWCAWPGQAATVEDG